MRSGSLVVFEGPDGVGKSTLADRTARYFQGSSQRCELFSFPGNEAGTLGKLVDEVHHGSLVLGIQEISPTSLQLLHVAAHIDSIENRIAPLLEDGTNVILDRFWWSTWVYGRRFGANANSLEMMLHIERNHWRGYRPAVLFLIDREEPFPPTEPSCSWQELRASYAILAKQEGTAYPVVTVLNEGPISGVLNTILKEIHHYA